MEDRQQPTISQTGVWIDLESGQVVESEPVSGKLLVAPGGEVDQRIRDDIAAAKLAAGQVDEPEADDEVKDEPQAQRGRGRAKSKATVADDTDKATE